MHEPPQTNERYDSSVAAPSPAAQAFEREWRERFVEFASLRDDDAGIAGWSTTGLDSRLRMFGRVWRAPAPGSLYLDVGCGAGTYSRLLAGQRLRVVGVDYSQPALRKAAARTPGNVAFCAADATRLPFADASVDGVLCLGVLQVVHASQPLVRELARVIRDGGTLWIDGLNRFGIAGWWDRTRRRLRHKPMHLRYESSARLIASLREAGFQQPALEWLPLVPSRLHGLQRAVESPIARALLHALPWLSCALSHSFLVSAERRRAL